jgi:uncharacterized protein
MATNAETPTPEDNFGHGLTTREQALEVSVFLFLIIPSIALSYFAVNQGSISFTLTAVATIMRDLGLVGLILFFLWRNREEVTAVGWTRTNFWADVGLGVIFFPVVFYGAALLERLLLSIGFSVPSSPQPNLQPTPDPVHLVLAIILVTVVAIAEETIFRGYLILRFKAIIKSSGWAVLISAVIFSLGHGYEGTAGVVTVGMLGVVYALAFLWRKSLVMPMTLHFLQDLLSIVILPLLVRKG